MRSTVIVLIILALPVAATADVIYSNYTAIQHGGAAVFGPDVPSPPFAPNQQAMPFPVIAPAGYDGYVLTSVDAAVEWLGYGPNLVRVSVYSDNGGVPGSELDWNTVPGTTLQPTIANAAMNTGVFLADGLTYWVVLYGVADSEFLWAPGDPKTYSGVLLYHDPVADGPWIKPIGDLDAAFGVIGTPETVVATESLTWGAVKTLFR